eukprot:TRINITY_DN16024_c0_g1_i1.p1 TRINITY_DN16024_c0_g1~~TRINITY_DN16024_c0_g1_i1.p1  ORF type:complete len:123 (-),score=39.14 TRINITY_DN16024_c0_g1_i1:46-384(-)
MPNLIVSLTFNPPVIRIMGATLRDETIRKLDAKLFQVTTTAPKKDPPKFERVDAPAHWVVTLDGQYCDHLGQSMMFISMIECLETEDWKLKGSNASDNANEGLEITKLFFVK